MSFTVIGSFVRDRIRPAATLAALPLALACSTGAAETWFEEVGVDAGLTHAHNSVDEMDGMRQMMAGAAAGDFDGDGWVDLYMTQLDGPDLLYRNQGDGTFAEVTGQAFPGGMPAVHSSGAAFADIDNDGDLDLQVTHAGQYPFALYVNQGDGTFVDEAAARNAGGYTGSGDNWGFGTGFGDYDRDGHLDMVIGDRGFDGEGSGTVLRRNRGAAQPGYFDDVTAATETSHLHSRFAFTPRFSDLDGDGWQDLVHVADSGESRLLWNDGDGTFTADTASGFTQGQTDMGLAIGDVNGDGLQDMFVSNIYISGFGGNGLYLNNGDRTFTYTTALESGGWGWGTAMTDYDNDGDLDIVLTNGWTAPGNEPFHDDPMRLWENDGAGNFTEKAVELGLTDTGQGRGLLLFDYDRDGDQDIVVARYGQSPVIYRNDGGNANDYLQVELVGVESNRFGIGARLELIPDLSNPDHVLVREMTAGPHYLSQSEALAHFGLGEMAGTVDLLRIYWPNGRVQELTDLSPNQRLSVTEIPEPASLALLGLGGLVLLRRGR